ncbi:unnamed protein product [Microthlaspi erraticum]|uniref:Uncharacterized protein n=1 Tax=Microthlaspi erraticum TaxID=1685480 RepID=A0A6D2JXZ6_9BRAS|nr:unnamed protein product [Microthlaspi erraticum]
MEVHEGIRNARPQGDYSDYALTEPCSFGVWLLMICLKTFQGEFWSHGPTRGESRQKKLRSIEPTRRALQVDRSTPCSTDSIDPHLVVPSRSTPCMPCIDQSQPFDPSRSHDTTAVRSTSMLTVDRTDANRIEPTPTL